MVSGGFDPLHEGHLAYLKAARQYGHVVVALNSDDWLLRKKGFVFQPWETRAEILRELRVVSDVIKVDDKDGTITDALSRVRPEYFANGGDRKEADDNEHYWCDYLGIKELFGVGGEKINSSSKILETYDNHTKSL